MRLAFPGLEIRNQNELKQVALKIFNQTFSSTRALIIIGLSVAFLGLALGLFSIFEESKSTWKTLRYLGFSNRQLVLIAGLEGGLVGLTSWFCGTVLGIAIGLLLVHVINVQSFGWTLIWSPSATSILLFGLLLVSVGFLCGCFILCNLAYKKQKSMRLLTITLFASISFGSPNWINPPERSSKGYLVPQPDYNPVFPRDHGPHTGYGIEWWYWVGHLKSSSDDNQYGFQSTIFRVVVLPLQQAYPKNLLSATDSSTLLMQG